MHLDRCIATNKCIVAICLNLHKIINGILGCAFISLTSYLINYLINYLSIIKVIFDIVLRAVNASRDKFSPPQLEQINTTIKHNRISLFDNVSSKKDRNVTIAIVSQNVSSAVQFLLCKILDCEVNYAK